MVTVRIPAPLRPKADGNAQLDVQAATLQEAVESVVKTHPDLGEHMLADDGTLHRFVNYFVNGTDVRQLDGPETEVSGEDTILVLPAVAGGSREAAPELTPDEMRFYGRHIILPDVGQEGQEKLKESSALLIGAGGLGAPTAFYLAAAGVGRIGIVDFDQVEVSNLHRQILYQAGDEGKPKAQVAKQRLEALNPHITVEVHEERLTSENALEILDRYDVVIDGTDNFPTRYLTNDACVMLGKPNVHASIFRFEGQASVFWPEAGGPCYRCLYPQPPPPGLVPSCAEGGVLGVLPGMLGVMQATEAVKILLGKGETLVGRLILYDAMGMSFDEVAIQPDPACPVCGEDPEITELIDYEAFCGIQPEDETARDGEITVQELSKRREDKDLVILDVREPWEHDIVHLEGAKHIPMEQVPERANELPQDKDLVVLCKVGGRSAQVVQFLQGLGFSRAVNLKGGIDAWVREVEPGKPTY
ncbi:MAG: molybdopterin-synthase adenylyltransferase MoeB [Candidatus Thermoplasmatota archaeon]|nr:molybdopterin-synthase adenylyltransferase MoeB [Candidatus Thermoplasmatota archaeon]